MSYDNLNIFYKNCKNISALDLAIKFKRDECLNVCVTPSLSSNDHFEFEDSKFYSQKCPLIFFNTSKSKYKSNNNS